MSDHAAISDAPRLYRISTLKDFLPVNDEATFTTRGQNLPTLIQSRSSANIASLSRSRPWGYGRRRSSIGADDPPRRSQDSGRDDGDDNLRRIPSRVDRGGGGDGVDERRMSHAVNVLMTPQMRSQRLIGNSNPRYRWEQYWKTDDELKKMKRSIRKYYERNNYLIQHYMYIDQMLDSSLPHHLIQEYQQPQSIPTLPSLDTPNVPATITEESVDSARGNGQPVESRHGSAANGTLSKVKRTPKDMYRIAKERESSETTPLIKKTSADGDEEAQWTPPVFEPEEDTNSSARIVSIAIYVNMVANLVLLVMKIIVVAISDSVSVLASLVDAALDFLSTTIVWITTRLIAHNDSYTYPIGRRRLEPVGVLVFSIIMITSFAQVALEGISKLTSPEHLVVRLTLPAIIIMAATVVIKGLCWLWCRLIKNSSVQALAQDAMTDVVFNTFSIIFPLIGYYASVWWLDPLGGVLLSVYVIFNWGQTSSTHIRNLTGCAASSDERNVLLYLTMRFAKTIKQIQGLQAYHSGDKLNVEVDLVMDENTNLRDSHDLGESLQYVLESVPNVDRAFVHLDYASYNLPSHMQQDS